MGNKNLDYGPRLSGKAYDHAIVGLYKRLPSIPSKQQRQEVSRRELDLTIDYRLGLNFPKVKRDALWVVQQDIEKHHIWFMFKYLLRRIFDISLTKEAKKLSMYVVDAYSRVLNKDELEQFFGEEEAHNPSLPIDFKQ